MRRLLASSLLLLLIGAIGWRARVSLRLMYPRVQSSCLNSAAHLLDAKFPDARSTHAFLRKYAALDLYGKANRSLPAHPSVRVVFFGDSITRFWATRYAAEFFPGRSYVGRGVSGQSTREMIWRFDQDAVDLRPHIIVILAGANDILSQDVPAPETEANLKQMIAAARRHGVRVILCSVLPVAHYPPKQQAIFSERIEVLNAWLRTYAAEQQLSYVDYYRAMAGTEGALRSSFTDDGVHPNAAGYAIMRPLAQSAIDGPL